MIPRYGKLNKIYTGIMSGDSFSFEKQQFISDFYREYGDTQPFETALIDADIKGVLHGNINAMVEAGVVENVPNELLEDKKKHDDEDKKEDKTEDKQKGEEETEDEYSK